MDKQQTLQGIKYDAKAGSVGETVQKMLEIANKEHAFVYETINDTPLVVEPGMSEDSVFELLHDIRSGKKKIAFYNPIKDFSVEDIAKSMEILAKDNDIVISDVNGTPIRIFNGMTAKNVLDTLQKIRETNKFLSATQKLKQNTSLKKEKTLLQSMGELKEKSL